MSKFNAIEEKKIQSEVQAVITEIENGIEKNKNNGTYRKYETFFKRIGMSSRKNFYRIDKLDALLKKNEINLWEGKQQKESLRDFEKGSTIYFKKKDKKNTHITFAGRINIEPSDKKIIPYKHQEEAYHELQTQIVNANKKSFSGLLVLPTGGGKTFTAAWWICKNFLDKGKKVLWIAHRHELLDQAKESFKNLAYKNIFQSKSSFNFRILSGIHDQPVNIQNTDDLLIASKDSLNAGFEYLTKHWVNETDEVFLVIDEAHHATAKTYRKLIDNLKSNVSNLKILGLTATPTRTAENEQGLLKKVFQDDIVYKVDLKTLIRLGILSEPVFEEIKTGQSFIDNLSEQTIERLNHFDINSIGEDVAKSIAINKERNFSIVNQYVQHRNKYNQTLVFALNVDNAIALNALFQDKGIKSDYVVSNVKDAFTGVTTAFTKENKEKIRKFREGSLEVLINVNILTEGTDVPNVQSIFLARPTISTILMTQMIGRGLRGEKAGGTKQAYIVSFVDDWKDKIGWANPEKLYINDNVNFTDIDKETRKQLIRLISINKIEEFAIMTNSSIDSTTKRELENLDFIQRVPKGVFQFKFLDESEEENKEVNCEILVYDNMESSYKSLLETLPYFIQENGLEENSTLLKEELEKYTDLFEQEFFKGIDKYPAYNKSDIQNILQYYITQGVTPSYVELQDRDQYNIEHLADEIWNEDMGSRKKSEFLSHEWENNNVEWQTFFNYDKRVFLQEIDNAIRKKEHPELYEATDKQPIEENEIRSFEKMSLFEIRNINPVYEKELRDQVFENFKDEEGFYVSAESGFRSKNKLAFQVDHKQPISKGGLTTLDNLQLLTPKENGIKGDEN